MLNPRQATWALFFARLQFTLSYRTGLRNVKTDALSRLYDAEDKERGRGDPPIISPSRIIAPVVWDVDANIWQALHMEPSPAQWPENTGVRDRLLTWVHIAPVSGHPGISRTIACLTEKYWWPTLARDARVYISS